MKLSAQKNVGIAPVPIHSARRTPKRARRCAYCTDHRRDPTHRKSRALKIRERGDAPTAPINDGTQRIASRERSRLSKAFDHLLEIVPDCRAGLVGVVPEEVRGMEGRHDRNRMTCDFDTPPHSTKS